ncbi:MAG: putative GST-like protein YibF [Stenotrophomonas maltophilia]|nr:MAG: putative GST-like protein YibF [Stenotrophomonas maltophilia]
MQLIGMLDSPYVRRVAISLRQLEIPFEHRSLSVFGGYAEFQAINPVVKAPTLVLDDGQTLMESSLILECLQHLAGRSLLPEAPTARIQATRRIGLALAACDKAVQIVYETQRATERQDAAWLARVEEQLHAACAALEAELQAEPLDGQAPLDQVGISLAVAWRFIQLYNAERVPAQRYLQLAAWSAQAEALPVFQAFPPT